MLRTAPACAGAAAAANAESNDPDYVAPPAVLGAGGHGQLHRGLQARDANICGAGVPAVLTDQTGTLSDDQTGPNSAVDCTAGGCGGLDTGSNGYGDNLDCTKTIQAPVGTVIGLTIAQIALESGTACGGANNGVGCDVLTVYDGPNANSPVLGTFSGTDIPRPVRSTGNTMTVRFTTDGQYPVPSEYHAIHQGVATSDLESFSDRDCCANSGQLRHPGRAGVGRPRVLCRLALRPEHR